MGIFTLLRYILYVVLLQILISDDFHQLKCIKCNGFYLNSILEKSIKEFTTMYRCSSIKSESEFIKINSENVPGLQLLDEFCLKFHNIFGVIFHYPMIYILYDPKSSDYLMDWFLK